MRTALALLFILAAAPVLAAPDIEAGHALAQDKCARCHAIGKFDAGAHDKAPPFRMFEQNWPVENLAEALAEGIAVGHPEMPEFMLTPQQVDDLLAYLKTIQVPQ
ncbi:MAG: cytochrome c [Alphaproteobacteria bacterium]